MSSTDQLIDLVNRVADGEASNAEQAELQRLMHDSAEARALFAETREVFRRLDSLPEIDPPHQLRKDILESTHPANFQSADLYFPLTQTKTGGNMSADRRKQMLIGFGGLAVVLVGTFIFVSPSYNRPEDASGAIGAVQKHRETQIAPQDVVLGDEQLKEEQQVSFASLLDDAAQLRSIEAEASVAARSVTAAARMQARQAELAARYATFAAKQIEAMRVGARELQNELGVKKFEAVTAEIDDLSARVRARELQAADMDSLNMRLRAIENELGARKLYAENLEARATGIRAAVDARNVEAANREIELAARGLNARTPSALMAARSDYLSAISKQAKTLAAETESLAARANKAAESLEAQAVSAMQARLSARQAEAEALGRMKLALDASTRSFANAKSYDARTANAFAARLQAESSGLDARMNSEVNAQLASIESHLGAREQANARIAARSVDNALQAHLAAISSAYGARTMQAKAVPDAAALGQKAIDLAARIAN